MNEDLKIIQLETYELKNKINQLCSAIDNLQKDNTEVNIDFFQIRRIAAVKPLTNLLVLNLDDYVKELYYLTLMYSLNECKIDSEQKLVILQRIMNGSNLNVKLETLKQKAYTFRSENIDELIRHSHIHHFEEYFFLDLLLVNGVNGKIESQALSFVSYMATFLGLSKDVVKSISLFARSVIEQNQDDCISSLANTNLDLNLLKSYIPQQINGYILTDLYQNSKLHKDNICVINQVFSSQEIAFENIYGDSFTFKNCVFENLIHMHNYNEQLTIRFENCQFINRTAIHGTSENMMWLKGHLIEFFNCNFQNLDSSRIDGFLYFKGNNVKLQNCNFSQCSTSDGGNILYVENGTLKNLHFNEITVNGQNRGYAGIVNTVNSNLDNIHFEKCTVNCHNRQYGRFAHITSCCLKLSNSSLYKSSFNKCSCDSKHEYDGTNDNCIVYSIKSTTKNLSFETCNHGKRDVYHDYGREKYYNLREDK